MGTLIPHKGQPRVAGTTGAKAPGGGAPGATQLYHNRQISSSHAAGRCCPAYVVEPGTVAIELAGIFAWAPIVFHGVFLKQVGESVRL